MEATSLLGNQPNHHPNNSSSCAPGSSQQLGPTDAQPPTASRRAYCANCTMPLDDDDGGDGSDAEGGGGGGVGPHAGPALLACPYCHHPVTLPPISTSRAATATATAAASGGSPTSRAAIAAAAAAASPPGGGVGGASGAAEGSSPLWAAHGSAALKGPGGALLLGQPPSPAAALVTPAAAEPPASPLVLGAGDAGVAARGGGNGAAVAQRLAPPAAETFDRMSSAASVAAGGQPLGLAARDDAMASAPHEAGGGDGRAAGTGGGGSGGGLGPVGGGGEGVEEAEPEWDGSGTVLGYDDRMLAHSEPPSLSGREHPERPNRLVAIMQQLQQLGLLDRCKRVRAVWAAWEVLLLAAPGGMHVRGTDKEGARGSSPRVARAVVLCLACRAQIKGRAATDEELEAVHDPELLRQVRGAPPATPPPRLALLASQPESLRVGAENKTCLGAQRRRPSQSERSQATHSPCARSPGERDCGGAARVGPAGGGGEPAGGGRGGGRPWRRHGPGLFRDEPVRGDVAFLHSTHTHTTCTALDLDSCAGAVDKAGAVSGVSLRLATT